MSISLEMAIMRLRNKLKVKNNNCIKKKLEGNQENTSQIRIRRHKGKENKHMCRKEGEQWVTHHRSRDVATENKPVAEMSSGPPLQ